MDSKKINQLGTEVDPQQSDLTVIGDPISGQLKKITWLQVAHLIGAQASVTLQQVTDNGNTTTDPITTGGLTLTNLGTGLPRLTSGEFVGTYGYGLANGVATLDSGGKIPASQLPSSVMEYKGVWNASTNTPTLADGTGDNGDVYLVNVAGSQNLGSGTISFAIGDWVVYNGTIWQKSLNSNAVASVFGRTGTIVAQEGDYNIDQLGDVAITTPATNDYLRYNGSSWVNTQFPTFVSSDKLVLQVRNTSGATINKGTVVYVNGASGGYPTIAKALANADNTSAQTLGLVQDNIANNSNGVVVIVGQITGIDTSAYAAGTQLYLSGTTAGAFTSTKTLAPTHLVYVGIVTTQNAVNGVIEVKIQNGYELEEIHDVALSSPTNNQVLVYESATDLWKNKSISTILGGTPVTGSGTNNYIPKFTTTGSTIGDSVIYNDGASIRINTTAVHNNFTANLIVGSSGNANLEVRAATFDQASIQLTQGTSDSSTSPRVEIYNSGNFGIVVYKPSVVSSNFVLYYDTESATNRSLSFQTEGSDRLTLNQSGTVRMNNYTTNGFVKFSGGDGTLSVDTVSYLPLTGGTLTGTLNGTNAVFSSSVQSSAIYLTNMTAGSGALYYSTGENRLTLANYNANGIIRFETNGGTNAGTVNAAQEWTFPSNVYGFSFFATNQFLIDAGNYFMTGNLRIRETTNNQDFIDINAGNTLHTIQSGFSTGGANNPIRISANGGGNQLYLATDGTIGIGTNLPSRLFHVYANTSTTTPITRFENTGTGDAVTEYRISGYSWYVGIDNSASGSFKIGQDPLGTSDRFTISDGGAATFNSSVTANQLIGSNSGSIAQVLLNTSTSVSPTSFVRFNKNGSTKWDVGNNVGGLTADQFSFFSTSNVLVIQQDGKIGIGTPTPLDNLHIAASETGNVGISVQNTNASYSAQLRFLNSAGTEKAAVTYVQSSDSLVIANNSTNVINISSGSNVAIGRDDFGGGRLGVRSGGNTSAANAMYVDNSSSTELFSVRNDGFIRTGNAAVSPYNNSTTGRSVVVESGGGLGYTSSTRESKTNIQSLQDVSWIYQLNPVSFNYRIKDDQMNYTDEFNSEVWYGLIADEVEKINKDLVFYDERSENKKLAGVEYNKITSALIKAIQIQQAQIEELKEKLN